MAFDTGFQIAVNQFIVLRLVVEQWQFHER